MICQRFDQESFRTKDLPMRKVRLTNTATVKVVTITGRILFPSRRAKHSSDFPGDFTLMNEKSNWKCDGAAGVSVYVYVGAI